MKNRNMPLSLIGGWFLEDEPEYIEINEYSQYYKTLAEGDPTRMPIINLVGSAEQKVVGTDTCIDGKIRTRPYDQFIDTIQDKFKPAVWSYDLYPFKLSKDGFLSVDYNLFYGDLIFFSYMSKKKNDRFGPTVSLCR